MSGHTYPPERAGYMGNEAINLPRFPLKLFTATCPRCLTEVVGPPSGLLVWNEQEGNEVIGRLLGNHSCRRVRLVDAPETGEEKA